MALEKEARTNIMGSSLDIRNRNWQKIDTHLAEDVSQGNPHDVNALAKKGRGEIYLATLGQGWTGTIEYSKNDLGQVVLTGSATAGTIGVGTRILTLPEGYRPLYHVSVSVVNFTTVAPLADAFMINTLGGLDIRKTIGISSGDSIRFNVIFQAD